jgi:hypothetical protein
VARAWGVLPDQLLDLDAGTYRLMVEQLTREAIERERG